MADTPAFLSIWARGYDKSTSCELGSIYLGARGTVDSDLHREIESDYRIWLYTLFPDHMGGDKPTPMADYHHEFWRWLQALSGPRKYALYISDTQEQADQHVSNIGDMLTSPIFAAFYPEMAARRLTKFGQAVGWRRNRISTKSGYTIDAGGLEKGIRGARVGNTRPDLIVFDDLDSENDSPTVTERKERNLTRSIIPAQGPDCAFIGAQNLILRGGIFSKLADGTADYLLNRRISGPHPALADFDPDRDLRQRPDGTYELVGGVPTWRDAQYAEALINAWGLESFMVEAQHAISTRSGLVFGQFSPEVHEFRYPNLPEFVGFFGGVDCGGEGDTAHNSACTLIGITNRGRCVLLREWYANGASVFDRQWTTMQEWDTEFGHIKWCLDGDERTTFQTLRTMGFDITMSKRHAGSVEQRIRRLGRLLNVAVSPSLRGAMAEGPQQALPGFFYLRQCRRFRHEIERWRRPAMIPGVPYNDKPIGVDDDVLVSLLYAIERSQAESDAQTPAQSVAVAI